MGASAVEYALLVGLIAVVCVAALVFVGGSSSEKVSVMGVHLERPAAGTSSNPLDFSAEPADVTDENYFGPAASSAPDGAATARAWATARTAPTRTSSS